ncbi:probable malate dehydrogenase, mitochondrial [Neodiprion lecontei]|uniref:malate dehydrogenase n=1 Tax=Neodiprion lecontei TaxID=441921 RepID=A0ABM3FUR2_NEOLC|nr:probable malate dehydrogenase, mitochondrial [Neodiprion lecontei]
MPLYQSDLPRMILPVRNGTTLVSQTKADSHLRLVVAVNIGTRVVRHVNERQHHFRFQWAMSSLRKNLGEFLLFNANSRHHLSSRSISILRKHKVKTKSPSQGRPAIKPAVESSRGDFTKRGPDTVSVALIGGGTTPAYTALLLKQAPIIKRVHIADTIDKTASLILDASHVDTSTKIRYFKRNNMIEAMQEVDIIAIMDEEDFTLGKASSHGQFLAGSQHVKVVAEKMVHCCPTALVAVFAHPVTATLPLISEIYKRAGCWDPNRIVGSVAIDSMRIQAMAANLFDLNPAFTTVPIVGGADACTVVPLLSRAKPVNQFSKEQQNSLIHTLRASDNELASIGECRAGPTLSAAAAATKFIVTLACGYCGFKNAVASAFVRSNVLPVCRYFATELQFGPGGVEKSFGLPKVSSVELELVEQAIPIINANVDLAVNFIRANSKLRSKM